MKTKTITLMGIAVALNIVGSFIAVTTKLPIFLDTIGTLVMAFTFGPIYGLITGTISGLVTGVLFDPYAIFFLPCQMLIGLMGGLAFKKRYFLMEGVSKIKNITKFAIGVLITAIPASLVGAVIASFVFGGVTSSGTTVIVQILNQIGMSMMNAVFSVQVPTDILDKTITILLALTIIKALKLKTTLSDRKN